MLVVYVLAPRDGERKKGSIHVMHVYLHMYILHSSLFCHTNGNGSFGLICSPNATAIAFATVVGDIVYCRASTHQDNSIKSCEFNCTVQKTTKREIERERTSCARIFICALDYENVNMWVCFSMLAHIYHATQQYNSITFILNFIS